LVVAFSPFNNIFTKTLRLKNFWIIILIAFIASCNTIDIYEKTKPFSSHEWKGNEKPSFTFEIKDTASLYDIFLVFRHTDAYNFNNIWVNVTTTPPGDTATTQPLDLKLADNQNGWLGSGMDDIFEHRIKITATPVRLKAGKYNFNLQQIMREEPLKHVLNAGIRVEKIKLP
jgi:gliding motility-associated lipoprotein GldH